MDPARVNLAHFKSLQAKLAALKMLIGNPAFSASTILSIMNEVATITVRFSLILCFSTIIYT